MLGRGSPSIGMVIHQLFLCYTPQRPTTASPAGLQSQVVKGCLLGGSCEYGTSLCASPLWWGTGDPERDGGGVGDGGG